MTERTIKIKGLISGQVDMGTFGLVELELLAIEKEMEALRQPPVMVRSEQLKCDCGNTENVKLIPICPCCYNPHSGEW